MRPGEVIDLFTTCDALLEGHFRLTSGLHSPGYLQCALVLQYPERATMLGVALADRLASLAPDLVLSPALGGLIIGHEVARALGVRAVFAERRDGTLTLRRGFRIGGGERVVVVEDVVTTGGSTRETVEVATRAGGQVVGTGAIINRGGPEVDVGVRFDALAEVSWPAYAADDCPMCAEGVGLDSPGSRPSG